MKTHQGNVGSVLKDIALITFDTLRNFLIPYDEIYFGKPHADFYIDDLAVNAFEDIEKRIGFYKTSIQPRDFNDIKSDNMDIIVKKSQETKLQGEIHYYQNIPNSLKHYFPVFIDYGHDWYSMQKINGITLSYLFTTESLTPELLEKYLGIFYEIHSFPINIHQEINFYNNYAQKIIERYSNYDYSIYENSLMIYEKLLLFFKHYQENEKGKLGLIHGDAVFSNAIITKDNEFKLIDMRGIIDDKVTMFGDIFYDYGKIYQSLLGYDEILLNKYVSNQYKYKLIHVFESFIEKKFSSEILYNIKMITNSLLFSLLPLHQNTKCFDFFKLINI
jgi:thiamine kinase-like enzyme